MRRRIFARDELWDIAEGQHGFVTIRQANDAGVSSPAVRMLGRRGSLEKVAHGVYRIVQFPRSPRDEYALALLWTGAEEAAISHESALYVHGLIDRPPRDIHVTVAAHRRIRRAGGELYILHYADRDPGDIMTHEGIRVVSCPVAFEQCIAAGQTAEFIHAMTERARVLGLLTLEQSADFLRHPSPA